MSRIPEEILPYEEQQRRSPLAPVEPSASARPIWDWEELNAKFRPRLIAAGVIRFGLTQDECEDAAQTVFLKVLAMNPRVRDPKAYLRAAFLNRCDYIIAARDRGHETAFTDRGHETAFTDRVAETARTTEKSGSPPKTLWKRVQDCLTKGTRS